MQMEKQLKSIYHSNTSSELLILTLTSRPLSAHHLTSLLLHVQKAAHTPLKEN